MPQKLLICSVRSMTSGCFTASSRPCFFLPPFLPCLVIVNESGTRSSSCWGPLHTELGLELLPRRLLSPPRQAAETTFLPEPGVQLNHGLPAPLNARRGVGGTARRDMAPRLGLALLGGHRAGSSGKAGGTGGLWGWWSWCPARGGKARAQLWSAPAALTFRGWGTLLVPLSPPGLQPGAGALSPSPRAKQGRGSWKHPAWNHRMVWPGRDLKEHLVSREIASSPQGPPESLSRDCRPPL